MGIPELLAPAGSMESLTAALRCGADAVYAGGKSFSARQNAANFDNIQLKEAVRLCHLYGKKLYLTVNTIILDNQIKEFSGFIAESLESGVDAFIVQDPGAALIIKSISPWARLHASTQMTIHSVHGALTAKKLGFERAVLSRELTKTQIEQISKLDIETEIFVHGALCMSVSGQCYMSSFIGQRSANRGLCAQTCRLPFSACGNKNRCGLSLKDLSLIEHIDEIKQTGVSSLKIEGRMKRPEYVAAAVTAYRNAIDGKDYDAETLKAVFSRNGFTDGYFTEKYTGMFGTRMKDDVLAAKEVLPSVRQLYKSERKITYIYFNTKIKSNTPIDVTAYDSDGNNCQYIGNVPQKAVNKSISKENIEKQLGKLGGTIYNFGGLEYVIDDGLSVSSSELNEARRKLVAALNDKRIAANTKAYSTSEKLPRLKDHKKEGHEIRARISRISQLNATKNADFLIIPMEICPSDISNPDKIIIAPPRFIDDEQIIVQRLAELKDSGIKHLMCGNIAYLKSGKELGFILHGDFSLNVSNSYSAFKLAELGLRDITLSPELRLGQILRLLSPVPTGITAYGRLPLMLTKNCPVKNEIGCKSCRRIVTDRTGRSFKIVCYENYYEILNSQLLYLADHINDIRNIEFLNLYFTDETPSQVSDIIEKYRNDGEKMQNTTRGLYYRGVL